MLPGRAGRSTCFCDRLYRVAIAPVENVNLSAFLAMTDRGCAVQGKQSGRLRPIVVPYIVMHLLEMPFPGAHVDIESNDGSREKVVPVTIDAVQVGSRVAGRDIDQAEPGIDRRRCPDRPAPGFPGVSSPT